MTDWPWLHREGHMTARIVGEESDEVTFDYQHLRVSSWKGRNTADKTTFSRAYGIRKAVERELERRERSK